jgi:hypothetical protein
MATKIQIRRDTLTNFVAANVILANGELARCTNDGTFRIGDGATAFNALPVFDKKPDLASIEASILANTNAIAATVAVANNASVGVTALQSEVSAQDGLITSLQTEDVSLDLRVTALENNPLVLIDGGNAAG